MIRMLIALCVIFLVSVPLSLAQTVPPISVDLNQDHIDITAGFTGQIVTIFGVKRNINDDVTVVIEGPKKNATVRQKNRIFGAWMNTDTVRFEKTPSYYALGSTLETTSHDINNLNFKSDVSTKNKKKKTFQNALVRNQKKRNVYQAEKSPIVIHQDGNLFRADFELPANVPVGRYTVKVYENNQKAAEPLIQKSFIVQQIGMSAGLNAFAKNYAFLYALACIMLAMGAGWISNRLRSR